METLELITNAMPAVTTPNFADKTVWTGDNLDILRGLNTDVVRPAEGRCKGCRTEFPSRNLTIDHIIPVSRGGTDCIEYLQLLCAHSNNVKGDRLQRCLVAKLRDWALRRRTSL